MLRSYRHPIYGGERKRSKCCATLTTALNAMERLVYNMENTVYEMFPPVLIVPQIIGHATARAIMNDKLVVRLTWRQRYPGVYFDDQSKIQRLQIKAIYIEMGADHTQDPLFKDAIGLPLV
jgi:hypothetical protein